MSKSATREELRDYDRRAQAEFGLPGIVLMENAGRALAAAIRRLIGRAGRERPVVFFCGPGNNGGDGFVAARHLLAAGLRPRVFLAGGRPRPGSDAARHLAALERLGLEVPSLGEAGGPRTALAGAGLAVDAIFGTGLDRPVASPEKEAIEALNSWGGKVLAADIPSGLDANTGEVLGAAVTAQATITFVKPKRGFRRGQGPRLTGRVRVEGIGLPVPLPESGKNSFEPGREIYVNGSGIG